MGEQVFGTLAPGLDNTSWAIVAEIWLYTILWRTFLSQFPYLGLKTIPLRGQGSNLSLVRIRRPGGGLGKVGPPCQAFRISGHLPKKKKKKQRQQLKNKKSANRTETIKKNIDECIWTYRGGSLKQKSQSLLDGQGTHPSEVEVAQNGGNSPGRELRMRKERVLIPYSLKAITIPHHLIRHCRRGRGTPRLGTSDRNRENLQGGLIGPPQRVSSPDGGRRRGRGPHI